MNVNKAKEKLRRGETVFGCMCIMHHPSVVEILGYAGFDVVCIDGEHAPLDRQTCEHMVRAAECVGITPIFRSALNHPDEILPYLDTGITGVMVPHVNSAEEAQRVVDAVKYAPLGKRGMTPGRANAYAVSGVPTKRYIEASNRETLVLVQIEEAEAVRNLPEMLEINGIDVYVIGPGDLSHSLGYSGQREHPEVLKVIDNIIDQVLEAGKTVGTSAGLDATKRYIEKGVRYCVWGDARLFHASAHSLISALR
ncbi:MAG: HpcH/HpaI aldolase family protein [bacterium]